MLGHNRAPLYEALELYKQKQNVSLHVPGHKDGEVFEPESQALFAPVLAIDATEVEGLDDLHHPSGVIREAQQLAADAFGADETFFLIGGSTVGNLAAALTICSPGDTVLVQRNAHKSVFNGLLLAGSRPVYITPDTEKETGVAAGLTASSIRTALEQYPEAKAVWITNPNYYGMGIDVEEIAHIAHDSEIPLIVDEAHGAHFGQADSLPKSALQSGADLVVQSTHKMLTAMTMASMLHIQGKRISRQRLVSTLSMVQSSSPSYPLMASLDLARKYLVTEGREAIFKSLVLLNEMRQQLTDELSSLLIWSGVSRHIHSVDPFKWVLSSRFRNVSGYELLKWLGEAGIVAEMADVYNVVIVFPLSVTSHHMDQLRKALLILDEILDKKSAAADGFRVIDFPVPEVGELSYPRISLKEAFESGHNLVALDETAGKICGQMIIPYPPGIPLLLPGEKITSAHIQQIRLIKHAGGIFQGGQDENMTGLLVLANDR
ncbi:aminotransferase class I/II-fold pyridoxal phosphate-dependent enzyme [Aneurinibacillus sp. Ricciae_BoGa-3]|uniref:aminotransferase class I/II-fold pyridoxal phosphate-dependent enzyme n=1 Tax=Aneurinibacillus sp. Ricciae_BoGa-3 TaxID=3022697 RepID=UPI002340126B|nr:aminotransferase class I/II-fold pyridoxal phosphate-dependent enzyme [Aneurinibacillus sp. Ricciae_BoGa-3]WCK54610.1 aminotransferase class I/II-fold pyridoxal phosphate-dependent enzyme [Aneurinibacillus sp. Ricciae_BoGa-3]